jgi:cytochrome P450
LKGKVEYVGHNDTPEDFNGFFTKMLRRVPKIGNTAHMGYYTEDATLPFGKMTFEWFVVNSAEYGTKLLQSNIEHMLWPGLIEASKAFFGPKVLFVLSGDEWKRLRKVMRGELVHQNLKTYADTIGREAYNMAKKLQASPSVDMYNVAAHYHLDAAAGATFSTALGGVDTWPAKHDAVEAFVWFTNELPRRAFAFTDPALNTDYKSNNEDNRNMWKNRDIAHNVIEKIVKKRLENRATKDPDMLELMIRVYEEDHKGPVDSKKLMKDIGANLVELIFAGFNTVVGVMGTAFHAIAVRPDIVERIREEVDAATGGEDRPLNINDFLKLRFCQRLFHETCRRYSPSPVMARQIGPTDFTVGGVTLPKGTACMVPLDSLANDPRYWEKPEEYNPSRKEWDEAAKTEMTSVAMWRGSTRGAYMPFSDGPRNCVGGSFAQMEFVMLIASIFSRFDLQPAWGFELDRHFNGFGFSPRCGRTKVRGVLSAVSPRSPKKP